MLKRLLFPDNPIFRAGQVTAFVRTVCLIIHFFGTDPNGQSLSAAPLVMLPFVLAYHLASVWLVMGTWMILWKAVPRLRPLTEWLAIATFALLLIVGQIDLNLLRLTGNTLTLGIIRAYWGAGLWTRAVLGPVTDDLAYTLLTTALVFGAIAWSITLLERSRKRPSASSLRWRSVGVWLAIAVALIGWRRSGVYMDSWYGQPVEADLLSGVLGWNQEGAPTNEAATIVGLRSLVQLGDDQVWFDPHYPLVRGTLRDLCRAIPTDRRCATGATVAPVTTGAPSTRDTLNPPDIVVVVIESLRGADVGYLKSPMIDSFTPNLNRLASKSLILPHYISNGSTSPSGFFSINCSGWRHPTDEILGEYSPRAFDCLPVRLRSMGYFTMYLNASNPGFDRQLDWARPMYDVLDYKPPTPGIYNDNISEALLVDKFVSQLTAHDAAHPGQPFFAYVATFSTHPPFVLDTKVHDLPGYLNPTATGISPVTMPDAHQRYQAILRYTDAQLARIVTALDQRSRANNTIIIVVGDHSTRLEPSPPVALPYDFATWTGAIIGGPARLIGPPRRDSAAASHADLGATILALVGDTRPTASLGNNLLSVAPHEHRTAVSLRPAGYRLERDNCSLFVMANDADHYWAQKSFTGKLPVVDPVTTCPFTIADARQLHDLGHYWAYLVEHDRVWNPSFLTASPATPR